MTLLRTTTHLIQELGLQRKYWIGLSGGLDSLTLLSLCWELKQQIPFNFAAIHINHGISPHAENWAGHCQQICKKLDVPLFLRNITVSKQAQTSLEATAREQRYAIFAETMAKNDVLLTAHHQDDQAETFLLQLMRGSGLSGLASMPRIKYNDSSIHARPLLRHTRKELETYAQQKKLTSIFDESNLDTQYARNFIRYELMPRVKTYYPSASQVISRSAQHCHEAQALLHEYGNTLCAQCQGQVSGTLSVEKILSFSHSQQKLILRTWLKNKNVLLPNHKKLEAILDNLLLAKPDRFPKISWQDITITRYQNDIYLIAQQNQSESDHFTWDFQQSLKIPMLGQLNITPVINKGLSAALKQVIVKFRQGGERIHLGARGGRHSLKNLFQEWRVPPWERNRVPLIFYQERLIEVVGFVRDPEFTAKNNETGYLVNLKLD